MDKIQRVKHIDSPYVDIQTQIDRKTDIVELSVYIGDDDELNGIHCAWYAQTVDPNNEDDADLVEMINERSGNFEIKGKAILIS